MASLSPRAAALIGLAANLIARLLQKYRWIAYVGLAIIHYVACEMIYRGTLELIGASVRPRSQTCQASTMAMISKAKRPRPIMPLLVATRIGVNYFRVLT